MTVITDIWLTQRTQTLKLQTLCETNAVNVLTKYDTVFQRIIPARTWSIDSLMRKHVLYMNHKYSDEIEK